MAAPDAELAASGRGVEPADIEPAAVPSLRSILALQVGVVVVAALYLGREVLVPITVAVLLSFILTPLVSLLRRTRIGRIPSVIVAALLALGVVLVIGGVIGTQLADLATRLPDYVGIVQGKVEAVRAYGVEHLSGIAQRLGLGGGAPQAEAPGAPGEAAPGAPAPGEAASSGAAPDTLSPLVLVTNYLSPILSPFATAGIVFVVAVFILLQKQDLRDRMIRLFGSSDLHRTTVAMDDAAKRLSRYFLTLLAINLGFGVVIGSGLFFIGVPNPVLWVILSSVLRFVPYIGPFIAASLPIALAAAVDPGWSMVLWTVALFIAVELVFNQVVEPLAYGKGTGLSPFAVIVAAIFWGWLWGPVGLILSMPLTLCLVVLGRHVERLEFFDVLLGDRPALTPDESFYQRMLAGDAEEAQDQAELLLKERSLSSYYDEIALKGLQRAADDLGRGVLRADRLQRFKDTAAVLIAELGTHGDAAAPAPDESENSPAAPPRDEREIPAHPPPATADKLLLAPQWQGEAPVLCLAGKGPLDEATAAMLAQLLGKHGLGSRVAPYQAASRTGIATLDMAGVAMVCIACLDIAGSPSHLRYLIRRLKQKAPGVPVLVGLWPAEDAVLNDKPTQSRIGADLHAASLREAVDACVAEAQQTQQAAPYARGADPRPVQR